MRNFTIKSLIMMACLILAWPLAVGGFIIGCTTYRTLGGCLLGAALILVFGVVGVCIQTMRSEVRPDPKDDRIRELEAQLLLMKSGAHD